MGHFNFALNGDIIALLTHTFFLLNVIYSVDTHSILLYTAVKVISLDGGNMPGKVLKNTSLKITVKLAILHTIANTIYPSTARKIREAAVNAIDNNASWFIIHADRE